MSGTRLYEGEGVAITDRAYGYTVVGDVFRLNDQSKTSATFGDGCVYSSTRDMVRWDAALSSGKLLRCDLLDAAFTPGKLSDGSSTAYGFGWFLTVKDGVKVIHHAGGTSGFMHKFIRIPEKHAAIIIPTNRYTWG